MTPTPAPERPKPTKSRSLFKKPRVAAIGLDASQRESIEGLCGDLRPAKSFEEYLMSYSWSETDVAVVLAHDHAWVEDHVHLLAIGVSCGQMRDTFSGRWPVPCPFTNLPNTEREIRVPGNCPELYEGLATQLCKEIGRTEQPPRVVRPRERNEDDRVLIATTSGNAVAIRHVRTRVGLFAPGESAESIALALPRGADLRTWFRAFLVDVHRTDPDRVPFEPPRMGNPSDWYTPSENRLAQQISETTNEINRLVTERERLRVELTEETTRADTGIRRVLSEDGDGLVAAVKEILTNLGFSVRDMDTDVPPGELKREDLRLTLPECPGWEAIVEVKGYTRGTKTNDARQLREHRDRYMTEEGRLPDLTLWIANPHRIMDPSSRPFPDKNVTERAEAIGAVYVSVTDLFREWVRVEEGSLAASEVVERLVTSEPGRWDPEPPVPDS